MVVVIGGDLVGLLTTIMRWGLLTIPPGPPPTPEAEVVARLTEMVGLTVVVNVVVGDNSANVAEAGNPEAEEVFRPCDVCGEQWSFS